MTKRAGKNGRPLPSVEQLRRHLAYDPASGRITVTVAYSALVRVGCAVGVKCTNGNGRHYLSFEFRGRRLLVNRVAWALMKGQWPTKEQQIVYRNHDALDNRWANLVACSAARRTQNSRIKRNNKSGAKGVCFDKARGKWMASIRGQGRRFSLGRFQRKADAIAAYTAEATRLHQPF